MAVPPTDEQTTVTEFSANAFGRVFRCFTEPRPVFGEIAGKPTFFWVLLLTLAVALGAQLFLSPRIDMEATIAQSMRQAGREVSEEALQEAVKGAERFRVLGLILGPLGVLAVTFLLGGVYFLALRFVGSEAEYPAVLSAVAHAGFPPSAVQSGLMAVVASTRVAFPAQEIPKLLKSNLAAFLPEDAPKGLVALGEVLDIFNVWYWVLLVWGLSAVGKVPLRNAAGIVAVLWGAWTAVRVALALLR